MQIRLRVRGHLDPAWGDRLAGLRVTHEDGGASLLVGTLPDQAALHGLLLQIVRLGLPLLSLETAETPGRGEPRVWADTAGCGTPAPMANEQREETTDDG